MDEVTVYSDIRDLIHVRTVIPKNQESGLKIKVFSIWHCIPEIMSGLKQEQIMCFLAVQRWYQVVVVPCPLQFKLFHAYYSCPELNKQEKKIKKRMRVGRHTYLSDKFEHWEFYFCLAKLTETCQVVRHLVCLLVVFSRSYKDIPKFKIRLCWLNMMGLGNVVIKNYKKCRLCIK